MILALVFQQLDPVYQGPFGKVLNTVVCGWDFWDNFRHVNIKLMRCGIHGHNVSISDSSFPMLVLQVPFLGMVSHETCVTVITF